MTASDEHVELLSHLRACDYHFIAVTPETHARVLARPLSAPPTLRDIFGWNRHFREEEVDAQLLARLRRARSLEETEGGFRSTVRVASLGDHLFLHSAFPTTAADAVFFGPDTYRFARFVAAELPSLREPSWIVDMGAGSGAGGVIAAQLAPRARLSLIDINPAAVRLAACNARFAGVSAEVTLNDAIPEGCDLVIANPPYMIDSAHRTYRDGGEMLGGEVACTWTSQALDALAPRGTLLLYTGAAVTGGRTPLVDRISSMAREQGAEFQCSEIDCDIFGAELEKPEYQDVERIAALGIKITKR